MKARELSDNEDCCCCIPLYIGMILVEYVTLVYILLVSSYALSLISNDYIDAYFIIVILGLEVLLFLSLLFLCTCNRSKYKSKRTWCIVAIILFILTVIALTIWIMYYFLVKYQYEYIYSGGGNTAKEGNYSRTTKKTFIVWILFI